MMGHVQPSEASLPWTSAGDLAQEERHGGQLAFIAEEHETGRDGPGAWGNGWCPQQSSFQPTTIQTEACKAFS